jgi:aminopeptidase N
MPEVIPMHYALILRPDLEKFVFEAQLKLSVEAMQPVRAIRLNALALEIGSCRLEAESEVLDCQFDLDTKNEMLVIHLPRKTTGACTLLIDYRGQISDLMAGFYRSGFENDGHKSYIAVTQFQESDARRALPCFDHPAQKATFDIAMEIDQNLTAISNQVVKKVEMLPDGKKRVCFATTPKMSTYLVFFGVGPFEYRKTETDPRVGAVVLPGRLAHTEFGLDFGVKALNFCENYYDIDYPLAKMDLIAVPDFAFGAMENWGAITFRENLLLYYPDTTSQAGKVRIAEVIAHEIVHQWFGNLVTPIEWKYLWLNESFATYFGFGVVEHHYPDWAIWEQFLHATTATALIRDGLIETFAIELPGSEHVVINAGTAPLIYNKGASILRQVEGYIGADGFQAGLQKYLKGHAYDTATSHHLWEAFETASNKPVGDIMENWIQQPGYPLVEAKRDKDGLSLRQRRFTYLDNEFDQTWLIPVDVAFFDKSGQKRVQTLLLDGPDASIKVPDETLAYKLNLKQTGFYRVHYIDADNLEALGQMVAAGTLEPIDRWGLINDLFALVQKNTVRFSDFLGFLDHYQNEKAYLPLAGITTCIKQAQQILAAKQKEKLVAWAGPWFLETLSRIGYEPESDLDPALALLRDQMIWVAGTMEVPSVLNWAKKRFQSLMAGNKVHPDIVASTMLIGAQNGGLAEFEWFKQYFQTCPSEHDRLNVLTALGAFTSVGMIDAVLAYVLENVPDRNKFIPIASLAENPAAWERLWDWYRSNLAQIEKLHPLICERVIAAVISGAGMVAPEAVESFFESYKTRNAPMADVINLSLEKLAINRRMRTWCEKQ